MRLILLFALLFCSIATYSQPNASFTCTGTVVDPDNIPIANATVATATRRTTTNKSGNFSITCKIPDTLFVTHTGYAVHQVVINTMATSVLVRLDRLIREMEEVAVFSTGYQAIPKERATGSFTQIDNKTMSGVNGDGRENSGIAFFFSDKNRWFTFRFRARRLGPCNRESGWSFTRGANGSNDG